MAVIDRRTALRSLFAAAAGVASGFPAVAEERRTYGASWPDAGDLVDRIGVNTHLGQSGSVYDRFFERAIGPAVQDLGLTRIRDGAYAPVLGTTDTYYRRIRELSRMGCRFSAICYDPTNRFVTTPPRALAEIHAQFDGAIDGFEGGNEPDLLAEPALNPTLSWLHQRELHDTIRRELAGSRRPTLAAPSYILGNVALAKPLAGLADLANLHTYPGMEHPETQGPGRLAAFREAMTRVCGGLDAVVTETGYHTALATSGPHLPVSEAIRARYIPRLLLHAYLSGIRRTYLYELCSSFDRGPADAESAFGLLTHDGRQTPAYLAVKRLVGLFARPRGTPRAAGSGPHPPRALATIGDHADVVAAGFRRADGHHLMPIWLGVAGWDAGTRTARAALTRPLRLACGEWRGRLIAHRFDDDGSVRAEPVPLSDGEAQIAVSDRLTVLEFGA